jgi:hypothetical protein
VRCESYRGVGVIHTERWVGMRGLCYGWSPGRCCCGWLVQVPVARSAVNRGRCCAHLARPFLQACATLSSCGAMCSAVNHAMASTTAAVTLCRFSARQLPPYDVASDVLACPASLRACSSCSCLPFFWPCNSRPERSASSGSTLQYWQGLLAGQLSVNAAGSAQQVGQAPTC